MIRVQCNCINAKRWGLYTMVYVYLVLMGSFFSFSYSENNSPGVEMNELSGDRTIKWK